MSRFTTRPRPACSSGHRSSSPPCKMHFPLASTLCFHCRVLCTTLASKVFFAPGLSSHILSSLSSDSTPLKHLNPDSVQIYISSADLSSELQMHACNYLLNISNWRPDQLLKLKSTLPCHLPPPLHSNSVPSCCSDTKPRNHSGLLLFSHVPYPRLYKSCWLYLQNISRLQSLITTSPGSTLVSPPHHHLLSGLLQRRPI